MTVAVLYAFIDPSIKERDKKEETKSHPKRPVITLTAGKQQ